MSTHKKAAIILSGCGYLDGSEIHETTLLFLALARKGIRYHCFAPDKNASSVISYRSKNPLEERRNILEESARIARGEVQDLKMLKVEECCMDAVHKIYTCPGYMGPPDIARIFESLEKAVGAVC
jgi:enhancing lycopene biosynthesis protein 2